MMDDHIQDYLRIINVDNFIYEFNINEDLCDRLIDYHKSNQEYKHEGFNSHKEVDKNLKDSIDVSTSWAKRCKIEFGRNKKKAKWLAVRQF